MLKIAGAMALETAAVPATSAKKSDTIRCGLSVLLEPIISRLSFGVSGEIMPHDKWCLPGRGIISWS
jgi:hypothetical protein